MLHVYNAIRDALIEDQNKKGSRRKGVDHWKKTACTALDISKMGSARWGEILGEGESAGFFEVVFHEDIQKSVLEPRFDDSQEEETQEEETQEEVVEEEVVEEVIRTPLSSVFANDEETYREGDMIYIKCPTMGVLQAEVVGVSVSLDLLVGARYYTRQSSEVFETKRGASQSDPQATWRSYIGSNEDLKRERDELQEKISQLKERLSTLELLDLLNE
jgi:hypothetical protein